MLLFSCIAEVLAEGELFLFVCVLLFAYFHIVGAFNRS